jgi:hypothetical protein
VRRSQAPLFHLAESQIRREPNAVQSDKAPAAANFVNVLFICNPPLAWPHRRRTDGSAEASRSTANAIIRW